MITDIAVDSAGILYITDDLSLHKLTPDGAEIARWFSDDINPAGPRDRFFGHRVTVGPDDLLYVSSRNYVYKLTRDGHLLARIGNQPDVGQAGGPLAFSLISNVVVDPDGNIYVAHGGRNPVQMLSPAGELLAMWGTPDGKPDPDSHLPAVGSSMALTPDGALLLAAGDRILKLNCSAAE